MRDQKVCGCLVGKPLKIPAKLDFLGLSRIIISFTSFVISWVAETLWVDLESLWVTLSRFGIKIGKNESLIDKWNKKDSRSW